LSRLKRAEYTNSVNYITLFFGVKVVEGVFGYKNGKIFSGLTAEHVNCQRLSRKEDQTYCILAIQFTLKTVINKKELIGSAFRETEYTVNEDNVFYE
jgi:hypothetical protein